MTDKTDHSDCRYIVIPLGESFDDKWAEGKVIIQDNEPFIIVKVERTPGGGGWPPAPCGVYATPYCS